MAIEPVFGPLPAHWEVTTLGEACARGGGNIQTGPFGSQLHASDYVAFGIPSVMPQNIGDNRILVDGIARILPEDAQRLSRYLLQTGDIVYSRRGDVERRALVRDKENGWLCGTGCLRIRFGNRKTVDPLFASYYLGHPEVRAWVVRHAIGATMPNLNTSILSALPIVIPPLPEQRAIAHILGTLDDKIELNRRMSETLEAMARAIFKSWFVDFDPVRAKAEGHQPVGMDAKTAALFPDSFEDSPLGKIPKGWMVTNLPEAIEVNPLRSLSKEIVAPYLEMSHMPTSSARALAWENREFTSGMKFVNGDVLVARITPCLENGKTAFVDFLAEGQVGWGSTEYIVLHSKRPLPPEYAYFLARSDDFRSHAIQNMTGTSGRQRVPAECFGSYQVVVPPRQIAEIFGMTAGSVMRVLKQHDEESRTLAAIRDALLPKLLSGEVRVKDAADFQRISG